jgi:hypothetical protein
MLLRVATLIAVASATAAISPAVDAHADTVDQQYLDWVRSNGVTGGQDDTLIAFGHEWSNSPPVGVQPSQFPLQGQGVLPGQLYTVRMAASHFYCPTRVVAPPGRIDTGLVP